MQGAGYSRFRFFWLAGQSSYDTQTALGMLRLAGDMLMGGDGTSTLAAETVAARAPGRPRLAG